MNKNCVFILAGGTYRAMVPLFCYCTKKAYPDVDVVCAMNGPMPISDYYADMVLELPSNRPWSAAEYACMRFLLDGPQNEYDTCLITDIDLMMMKEDPWYVATRTGNMIKNGLGCYDNYQQSIYAGKPRVPGVHFVTRDWWDKTFYARLRLFQEMVNSPINDQNMDEVVLGDIIADSHLPAPTKAQCLWNHHGLHLGSYRQKRHIQNSMEQQEIFSLVKDEVFLKLANVAALEYPTILKIIKNMENALK